MRRASNTYRLQMIKDVATRQHRLKSGDPMAAYVQHLIDDEPECDKILKQTIDSLVVILMITRVAGSMISGA